MSDLLQRLDAKPLTLDKIRERLASVEGALRSDVLRAEHPHRGARLARNEAKIQAYLALERERDWLRFALVVHPRPHPRPYEPTPHEGYVAAAFARPLEANELPRKGCPDAVALARRSPDPGTCSERIPFCSTLSRRRRAMPPELFRYINIIQPRLGVTRLARALGVSVGTLDAWVCGYGYGVPPATATSMGERFWRLVLHVQQEAGRCSCRACLPSPRERLQERSWGRWLNGCVAELRPHRCTGAKRLQGAA